ncbi:MAG TPA: hypothetical protein EYP98_04950 [Planctomycetes bacterium]|nr:hypothetical protein [Planctomycetota bacterium]
MAEAFLVQADAAGESLAHVKQQVIALQTSYIQKHTEYTQLQLDLRSEVSAAPAAWTLPRSC